MTTDYKDMLPTPEAVEAELTEAGNAVGALIVKAIRELDDHAEKSGWDQPPRLRYAEVESLDAEFAAVTWKTLGGPMYQPGTTHPANSEVIQALLGMLKTLISSSTTPIFRQKVMAFVLQHEGWAAPMGTAEQRDRAMKASQRYEVHKMPDRVEIRIMTVADYNGVLYQMHSERGGRRYVLICDPKDEGGYTLTGNLVEPLIELQVAVGNIPPLPEEPPLPDGPWNVGQMLQYLGLPTWKVPPEVWDVAKARAFEHSQPESIMIDGEEHWTREAIDKWVEAKA